MSRRDQLDLYTRLDLADQDGAVGAPESLLDRRSDGGGLAATS